MDTVLRCWAAGLLKYWTAELLNFQSLLLAREARAKIFFWKMDIRSKPVRAKENSPPIYRWETVMEKSNQSRLGRQRGSGSKGMLHDAPRHKFFRP
jgi:hypothetical protein